MIRSLLSYPRMSARAVIATMHERIREQIEAEAVRHYFAECARVICENTAKSVGGPYITGKLDDILHPKQKDNRTGEEIVADVCRRAGLEVV